VTGQPSSVMHKLHREVQWKAYLKKRVQFPKPIRHNQHHTCAMDEKNRIPQLVASIEYSMGGSSPISIPTVCVVDVSGTSEVLLHGVRAQ
jgi:hypothetical protein